MRALWLVLRALLCLRMVVLLALFAGLYLIPLPEPQNPHEVIRPVADEKLARILREEGLSPDETVIEHQVRRAIGEAARDTRPALARVQQHNIVVVSLGLSVALAAVILASTLIGSALSACIGVARGHRVTLPFVRDRKAVDGDYGVILRSFEGDQSVTLASRASRFTGKATPLEHLVAEAVEATTGCKLVALARPGQLVHPASIRYLRGGTDWPQRVQLLVAGAKLVVFLLFPTEKLTEGLRWEAETCAAARCEDILLVLPPPGSRGREAAMRALDELLRIVRNPANANDGIEPLDVRQLVVMRLTRQGVLRWRSAPHRGSRATRRDYSTALREILSGRGNARQ